MARRAVLESGGFSLLVSDDEIRSAQTRLARTTGIFAEPAASAAVAGLVKISKNKKRGRNDQIVLLVTGHGLKDIDTALAGLKLPRPIPPKLSAVNGI